MIKLFTKHHDHDYKINKNISVNHHDSKLKQFNETKQKQLKRLGY